jgi:epoxyqueuosine reductase
VRFSIPAFANEQQSGIRRGRLAGSVFSATPVTAVTHSTPNPERNPSGATSGLDHNHARTLAVEAGFSEAGIVAFPYPEAERDADRFTGWIGAGHAASMRYLERVAEDGRLIRARVETPFPWARSAIVCFASYANPTSPCSIDKTHEQEDSLTSVDQPSSVDLPEPYSKKSMARSAWIARYAWSSRLDPSGKRVPSDYHKVLLKRLKTLESRLRDEFGTFESRAYVDTGPVVERSLAVAAGLGWTGKNTCLIHPKLGSFGFLAVLLTSLEALKGHDFSRADEAAPGIFGASAPAGIASLPHPDRCGSCTRCIEACPTHALDTPYQMDASRCIAYLTIEHKGPIAEELMPGIGRQVFGCDICQDVCPWNSKAFRNGPIVTDPDLAPRPELVNPPLEWLSSLDEQSFERLFNGSPVRRTGFNGFRRNIATAMGNSGLERFRPHLTAWAEAADEGLRHAAGWALARLRPSAKRTILSS